MQPAENNVVQLPTRPTRSGDPFTVTGPVTDPGTPQGSGSELPDTPDTPDPAAFFGLPATAFRRAWTIDDLQDYLQIGRTQAYALMKDPTAPPRLRVGRSYRWNGMHVMAWVHGHDWQHLAITGLVRAASHAQATFESGQDSHGLPSTSAGTAVQTTPTGTAGAPEAPLAPVPGRAKVRTVHRPGTADRQGTADADRDVRGGRDGSGRVGEVRVVDPAQVHRHRSRERIAQIVRTDATTGPVAR